MCSIYRTSNKTEIYNSLENIEKMKTWNFRKFLKKSKKKDQKSTKISLYLLRDEFFDYNIIKRFCRLGSKQSKTTKQLKIGQIGWKI